jgi:methylated-DNA-[protein]-cysteine S-methyltransferase
MPELGGAIYAYSYEYPAPVGDVGIAEARGNIIGVFFNCKRDDLRSDKIKRQLKMYTALFGKIEVRESELLKRAAAQLSEYLAGGRAAFDLPLVYANVGFSKQVYDELRRIPAGKTRSYAEIAETCGNPRAYRSVGTINRNNPIPFFIPCHRVIGGDGSLTGYAGGLPMKQYLLDLEQKYYV